MCALADDRANARRDEREAEEDVHHREGLARDGLRRDVAVAHSCEERAAKVEGVSSAHVLNAHEGEGAEAKEQNHNDEGAGDRRLEAPFALPADAAAPDPEAFAALEEAQRRRARRRDELRLSCAESQGRVKNHRESMSECARELNDPTLKGVDKALSKQVLELKTFEMTASDLDRYHGALDRALMAFHASKMSDINKVVKELWQRTYRGQDIDFIQIRSDAGPASGATGRSSYNYRVCMVVGDAELEMRGRCSAGQKVLACLIIRLALAETFCLNCGILESILAFAQECLDHYCRERKQAGGGFGEDGAGKGS